MARHHPVTMEATKKSERDDRTEQDREPETVFEDRISELPDAIIFHILSFLPTLSSVLMSVLSKRWRRMWISVPELDFCSSRDIHLIRKHVGRCNEKMWFNKFVGEYLKRHFADTTISKFKLSTEYGGCGSQIDDWLSFPSKKNVQEIDLCFRPARQNSSLYSLPYFVLRLRSLTRLKLNGLTLENLVPRSLPSLKELFLERIRLDDQVLNNLLLGCRFLEILHVNSCEGLLNPKVSSSSLKSMEFRTACQTIEIEAMNLRSFVNGQCGVKSASINLACCWKIRKLSLGGARLNDVEDLIPEIPLLESLELRNYYSFQHMNIKNQHLKDFVFTSSDWRDSLEITIDTPDLVSFSYIGFSLFKISVHAPNLLDASIRFKVLDRHSKAYSDDWYAALIKFLSEFNGSKNVCVHCANEKVFYLRMDVIFRYFHIVLKCLIGHGYDSH